MCQRQEVEANQDDEDIHDSTDPSSDASNLVEVGSMIGPAHSQIRHTPEDPAKERVEERAHQCQQVSKERNDLGDDESSDPRQRQDTCPRGPADDRVVALVTSTLENSEEYEPGSDRRIQNPEEEQRRNHERESGLGVDLVAQ